MELSYEETMRRIDEYQKNDTRYIYCKEKAFPWMVEVFKGEHQLIVVPYITILLWHGIAHLTIAYHLMLLAKLFWMPLNISA